MTKMMLGKNYLKMCGTKGPESPWIFKFLEHVCNFRDMGFVVCLNDNPGLILILKK